MLKVDLEEGPDAKPVSEQLAAALRKNATRVLDLFRSWDTDGDGEVSPRHDTAVPHATPLCLLLSTLCFVLLTLR